MSKRYTATGVIVILIAVVGTAGYELFTHIHTHAYIMHDTSNISSHAIVNPLSIKVMQTRKYPGSSITIDKILPQGAGYYQYLTHYYSDGLKIYALLAILSGQKPKNGWPVILFNHGYIPASEYETFPTVGQYAAYYPVFAKNSYIVFKPDYCGNGMSEGKPVGAYFSPDYTIDDLNALMSIKKYKEADPTRIGIWAHSMGGNIALRALVIDSKDVKAAVIWGGVVGSYSDILFNWHHTAGDFPTPDAGTHRSGGNLLVKKYKTPSQDPAFWNEIDPTAYLSNINTPIQLDVGGSDNEVPIAFSQSLDKKLLKLGKNVQYYEYPGDNHNISSYFNEAMHNSLLFFNKYVKGGENG